MAKPALAQTADAGVSVATDAGSSDAGAPQQTPGNGLPPSIRLPQSPSEKAEGEPIVGIEVKDNRRIATEDILSYVHEKIGQPFRVEALAADVRSVWDTGNFEDVQVDLTEVARGVRLRFKVVERPNIKSVEFEGNDELDNDKLNEVVEVKANQILNLPAVRRSVDKIKDAYRDKGYLLADVTSTNEPQKDNEVIVRFKIVEHKEVTVRRVTFIGNEHVSDSDLRDVMQTGQGSFFDFGSGGSYKQDVLERDILLISALYYDKGYMAVQIGTPRVMLTTDREGIDITIIIHEGPRFKIRRLDIYEESADGSHHVDPLPGRKKLREMIRANGGDWFNRAEIVKDLEAVRTLYKDAGYYTVEAEPQTEVDAANAQVDIIIPIKRGPPVRIERIEIKGNTKTRDKVIRRELEIQEGQLYSETGVELSRKRVMALGYFERVDVTKETGSSPDKVVIYFEIGERPTGTFQIGAGFSSIESFIATAQVQQANLFGNGTSLALQAQVSGLRQIISLRYFEPYFFDTDWSMSAEAYDQLYIFPNFARRSLGGSLTFGYALVQPWLRLSLTGTVEEDTVDTSDQTFFGAFGAQSSVYAGLFQKLPLANLFNAGLTISLRPTLVLDTRDNRLFPTSGVYIQASTELASAAFGSEVEYWRHRFVGRFYYPLGGATPGQPGSGFVIKLNTELGYISSPSPFGVPIYQRFFLGGILDIRGFLLRSIGPRLPLNQSLDPNSPPIQYGATIGGNLEAFMNLELEFPILDKVGIRGVVFFDAGNTWNTEDQFCHTTPAPQLDPLIQPCFSADSLALLRTSVGVGIRWFSPLGPLRFEWGFPLYRLQYEQPYDFEFTIGNFF
ncbi:MAG TPA: outer membrane protein assembly factor BamA [Polyangiaceae bacterium]|jgi:outer membrane protein insertion porin family